MLTPAQCLDHLAEIADDVHRLVQQADIGRPVPSCPG